MYIAALPKSPSFPIFLEVEQGKCNAGGNPKFQNILTSSIFIFLSSFLSSENFIASIDVKWFSATIFDKSRFENTVVPTAREMTYSTIPPA